MRRRAFPRRASDVLLVAHVDNTEPSKMEEPSEPERVRISGYLKIPRASVSWDSGIGILKTVGF
jgi:hypothetical protein